MLQSVEYILLVVLCFILLQIPYTILDEVIFYTYCGIEYGIERLCGPRVRTLGCVKMAVYTCLFMAIIKWCTPFIILFGLSLGKRALRGWLEYVYGISYWELVYQFKQAHTWQERLRNIAILALGGLFLLMLGYGAIAVLSPASLFG